MSRRAFAAALLIALAVRLATLPLPGHEDVLNWKIWSYAAARDVTGMYGVGGSPPTRGEVTWGDYTVAIDYPPFFLYECKLLGVAFETLYPGFPNNRALHLFVKLPVVIASALLTALLFWTVRRITGRDGPAMWVALAYWLNPATIVGGEMLGYVDPVCFLPAFGGLVLAYFRRPFWGGVLIAIGVATKPQGILIGPAFALALWQAGGIADVMRAGVTFAATLVAVVMPYAFRGAMGNMWLALGSLGPRRDSLSIYAANVGWIINWFLRSRMGVPEMGYRAFLQPVPRPLAITRFRELGYPNPRPIATAAVVGSTAWAMWTARRTRDLALTAAVGAFTVHAFFLMNTGVHEHHQLFEVSPLALAASMRPRLRPLFFVVSGIVTLNINYIYGAGIGVGWIAPRMITGVDLSVLLAFFNIGVFVWFARLLAREAAAAAAVPATSGSAA